MKFYSFQVIHNRPEKIEKQSNYKDRDHRNEERSDFLLVDFSSANVHSRPRASRQFAVDLVALPAKVDEDFGINDAHQEQGQHDEGDHVKEVVSQVNTIQCVLIYRGLQNPR